MLLNPDIATLIGFGCEAVLYGINIVLTMLALAFLVWRRRSRNINLLMVSATCMLFALCTTHFAIQFNHFYNYLRARGVAKFSAETLPLAVGDFILSVADFMGDIVLLYRCWLVWSKNYYIIIIPSLTALAGFVCGMVIFHFVVTLGLNHQQPPAALVRLGTGVLTLPLCTNVIVTALITGRIFYMGRKVKGAFQSQSRTTYSTSNTTVLVWKTAGIVVESGLLYLVGQLVLVVLFAMKNPAYKVMGYPIIQIYGIASTLIFCRVGLGVSAEQTYNTGASFEFRMQKQSNTQPSRYGHSTTDVNTGSFVPAKDIEGGEGEEFDTSFKVAAGVKNRD